ncbi:MAG: prepilin-type N-terminal cleavage/methylation domain-containing protein [Rhodocyclaceae bacterium]
MILFVVIVSVAAAGIVMVFGNAARSSADPLIRKQALAIAEALLEEVRLMPFTYCDPDDPAVGTATSPAGCATPEAMGPEAGENRYAALTPFDNVNDYAGFTMAGGILDMSGAPIAGLGAYSASIAVTPFSYGGIPQTDVLRITVSVSGPGGITLTLDGLRTRHAPNL